MPAIFPRAANARLDRGRLINECSQCPQRWRCSLGIVGRLQHRPNNCRQPPVKSHWQPGRFDFLASKLAFIGLQGQTEYSAQPKKCEDSANDDNQADDVDNGVQDYLLFMVKAQVTNRDACAASEIRAKWRRTGRSAITHAMTFVLDQSRTDQG